MANVMKSKNPKSSTGLTPARRDLIKKLAAKTPIVRTEPGRAI